MIDIFCRAGRIRTCTSGFGDHYATVDITALYLLMIYYIKHLLLIFFSPLCFQFLDPKRWREGCDEFVMRSQMTTLSIFMVTNLSLANSGR